MVMWPIWVNNAIVTQSAAWGLGPSEVGETLHVQVVFTKPKPSRPLFFFVALGP